MLKRKMLMKQLKAQFLMKKMIFGSKITVLQ